MSEIPSRDYFAEQLDSVFTIFFDGDTGTGARLVEVTELRTQPRLESFSLLFLAPPGSPVLQQLFKIEHPQMGTLELGLVPVGSSDDGVRYEAVFNRLIS